MASEICLDEQSFYVSNQRLSSLIAFSLQVSEEMAQSDKDRHWVEALRRFSEQSWPGIEFDLGERFPSIEEKKFWAQVFYDVARGIFLRQLGNHEITSWQTSAIGDAYAIARMLTEAVHKVEKGWHPNTE